MEINELKTKLLILKNGITEEKEEKEGKKERKKGHSRKKRKSHQIIDSVNTGQDYRENFFLFFHFCFFLVFISCMKIGLKDLKRKIQK